MVGAVLFLYIMAMRVRTEHIRAAAIAMLGCLRALVAVLDPGYVPVVSLSSVLSWVSRRHLHTLG